MGNLINVRDLHKPLIDAGLVPANCRLMRVDFGIEGALVATYEIFLTREQLATLGRVLQDVGAKGDDA